MRKTRTITSSTATAIRPISRARGDMPPCDWRGGRGGGPASLPLLRGVLRRRLLASVDLFEEVELDVVVVELLAHRGLAAGTRRL